MKNIHSVISSIITAVAIYVAIILNRKVDMYTAVTYDGIGGMRYKALIFLVLGIFVGWNLWALQKSNWISAVINIVIAILLGIILFYYLRTGFLYPMILIGAYGFMLISKLLCNKRKK